MDAVRTGNQTELTDLVNRIVSGERAAEAELVRRYDRGVRIVIARTAGTRSEAEDIYQDTFRIVISKIRCGDLREPERLSGFICQVARNTTIEHFRRKPRTFANAEEPGNAEYIADPAPNQLDQLLRKEKARIVRKLIDELKQMRDRELLFRYFIVEEEKDQICVDLGLTRSQFSNVVFRAIKRFRELCVKESVSLDS